MKNRPLLIAVAIIAVVVIGYVGWWLASPLFIDNSVDEAFPFEVPSQEQIVAMSDEEKVAAVNDFMENMPDQATMDAMPEDEKKAMEETVMTLAAAMPDKPMEDEMPEPAAATEVEWVVAAQGEFMDADSFHQGSGTATIFQQGTTSVLRFENFESTNGPDLHVLLVENINGTSSSELGEYVDLGSLKGNIGNQNYEIPDDVDLSKYSGVMIYCMPFHVVFATAMLSE